MGALSLFLAAGTPDWAEVIVVVLLVFGGAIQAIIKKVRGDADAPPARRPRTGEQRPGEQAPAPPGEAGRGGLERWRELERGAGPVTAERPPVPPPPPPPAPAPARRRPRPAPRPELSERHLDEWHSDVGASPFSDELSEEALTRRRDEARPVVRSSGAAAPRAPQHPVRALLRRRDAWREAILAAEVLGPPIAMRRSNDLPGRIPG